MSSTAMGTVFAPTYATLSMVYFELTLYRICVDEFCKLLAQFILENWGRFLGDCETALGKTKIDQNRLLEILDSINPSIKFKMETSDKELPFLDILTKRNDEKIWCLPFSSSHPNHCKKNISFTIEVEGRICNILGNRQQKLRHLSELKGNLKKYSYPNKIIRNDIKKP